MNINKPNALDATAEEEFLYQLNLSKCEKINKSISIEKKHPNTRSKCKLKRAINKKALLQSSASGGNAINDTLLTLLLHLGWCLSVSCLVWYGLACK